MVRFLTALPLFIRLLLLTDLGLAGLHLGFFLAGAPIAPLARLIDLDSETSVATWYSSVKHFLAAFISLPVGFYLLKSGVPRGRLFVALPLSFLLFSLDEVAVLHETLGSLSDALLPGANRDATFFRQTGIWMLVLGLPVVAALYSLVFLLGRVLQKVSGVRAKIAFGLGLFLAGALGVEVVANLSADGTLARHVQVFVEELLEMVGVSVVCWGFYELLRGLGFVWSVGDETPQGTP